MPLKKQIVDLERAIEETRASLSRGRAEAAKRNPGTDAELEHFLAVLAKLRAERIRLMDRQGLIAPSNGRIAKAK
jgi:hypothetical protein